MMATVKRGYYWSNKAYYWSASRLKNDTIMFGMYDDEGTTGEMEMKWEMLGGDYAACLVCFEDTWHTLGLFSDVIARLSEVSGECITPDEFVGLLNDCGFEDLTQYEQPK